MNMFKNAGGFTLVELIVVIAILAILAGVAVPAYSGYIAEANKTKDINTLEAVQVAAMSAGSLNGETSNVVKITVAADGTITDVAIGNTAVYDHDVAVNNKTEAMADFETFAGTLTKLVLAENQGKTLVETDKGWVPET